MDTLRAMQVFVEVARCQGFAPAAKALGLSTSSVSRHVTNLEDLFGEQLFSRTTRHLRLTPAGENLLGQCLQVVIGVDELVQTARRGPPEPRGRLRVTMPDFLGAVLVEGVTARFAIEHPEVDLEVVVISRVVNMVEEGFDLAVRTGQLADSTLMSRKLLDMYLTLVASPDYIARRGRPQLPDDLKEHNCIIDSNAPYGDKWPLRTENWPRRFPVKGNIRVNSGSAARDLAVGGAGCTLLPGYLVQDAIDDGRLITMLKDYVVDEGAISMVYPQSRHPSSAVRKFMDMLIEHVEPLKQGRQL